MIEVLEECVLNNKIPFLGICIGMQLLADKGYEKGIHQGLGWIKGSIKKAKLAEPKYFQKKSIIQTAKQSA